MRRIWTLLLTVGWPATALAEVEAARGVRDTGVSAIWMLANLSYAGMRAQDSNSRVWRIVAFICGFPGTLVSFLLIHPGSERAFGVDLPRHRRPDSHLPPRAPAERR